jgi:hypothetical protein
MDERARDTEEKLSALEAAMERLDDEAIVEAAGLAELALEFRDADAMIGLEPVDPARVERLRSRVDEALALAAGRGHAGAAAKLAARRAAEADFEGAVEALAVAAERGDAPSAALAARYVLEGRLASRAAQVTSWLDATSGSDATGAVAYANALFAFHGVGREQDRAAAVALHEAAAAKGHADAMFELYAMKSQGLGGAKDPEAALAWCRRAAEAGNTRAMANLGGFYATGSNGVEKDLAQSVLWYDRAARAGHGKAAATLGVMYAMGGELDEDPEKAREYFALAEEVGYPWEQLAAAVGLDPDEFV